MNSIWQPVDENATIAAWESRFATGDAYLAESEICTEPIIPVGQTASTLDAFWNGAQGAQQATVDIAGGGHEDGSFPAGRAAVIRRTTPQTPTRSRWHAPSVSTRRR